MPIYEYQCQKCHHHLEALQKFSDKPLRECPECGKHTLLRLMSAPMFRLAGSGWYETDFKSDKENKRNLAGKDDGPPAESSPTVATSDKAEKKAESKSESKSESKPESKPEPAATKQSVAANKSAAKPVARPKPAAKKTAPKKTVRKR
jgi:putative FmdB family regulatory protein